MSEVAGSYPGTSPNPRCGDLADLLVFSLSLSLCLLGGLPGWAFCPFLLFFFFFCTFSLLRREKKILKGGSNPRLKQDSEIFRPQDIVNVSRGNWANEDGTVMRQGKI